jgi:hypothetical protein
MRGPRHRAPARAAATSLDTSTPDGLALDLWPHETVPTLEDPAAYQRACDEAVAEAEAVLHAGWRQWLAEHDVSAAPALQTARARVTVVGERPETYHLVALVRFTFSLHGQQFRGYARGPASAPVFVVERVLDPAELSSTPPRRDRRLPVVGRKRLR